MKKILLVASLASLSLFNTAEAKTEKKVVIDLATLKAESKAGREFAKKREEVYRELQTFEMKKRQEVSEIQRKITEEYQAGKITQEDAQRRVAQINRDQRRAEFEVQEKRDEVLARAQRLEQELEEKLVNEIPKLAEKNGWTDVREARTGGTLYVASQLDQTEAALDAINKAFEAENLKSQLTNKATAQKA